MTKTERVQQITYLEKKIIFVNYSGLTNDKEIEFIETIDYATEFMLKHGNNLLILSDFTDSFGSKTVFEKLKQASAIVKPHRKKSAVLGISTTKAILLRGVNLFSQSDLQAFNNIEQAKKWLVKD